VSLQVSQIQSIANLLEQLLQNKPLYEILSLEQTASLKEINQKIQDLCFPLTRKVYAYPAYENEVFPVNALIELLDNAKSLHKTAEESNPAPPTSKIINFRKKVEEVIFEINALLNPQKMTPTGIIPKFSADFVYETKQDDRIDKSVITVKASGIDLIIQYYTHKYNAAFNFSYANENDFLDNLEKEINQLRQSPRDCRMTFLIGRDRSHILPIVYIRENNQEGILIADTTGMPDINPQAKITATEMVKMQEKAEKMKINFFAIKMARQASQFSCRTDALILGRDATSCDPSGNYRTLNLLEKLQKRAVQDVNYKYWFDAKLPDELLKSAQISVFKQTHKEDIPRKIHKEKTLSQFWETYTESLPIVNSTTQEKEQKQVATYSRVKSFKFIPIMQIQFYCNQLQRELGDLWTDELKNTFIGNAKKLFKSHGQTAVEKQNTAIYKLAAETLASTLQDKNVRRSTM